MEHLQYRFVGDRPLAAAKPCIVGVVASGNLEILVEPAPREGACTFDIRTPARGFADVWHAVAADFCARHRLADLRISINDNGATPATVALRLEQALGAYASDARAGGDA